MFDLAEHKMYNKLLEERIIFLDGEITDRLASKIVSKLLYLDSESNDDITIYINSPGGSVTAGLMIYDTMKFIKSEINTICIGEAAFMASIILMGGTKGKRKILNHALVMIHDISGEFCGKFTDVMVAAEELQKSRNILFKIMKECTNIEDNYIRENMKKDNWLDCNEAISLNIVDHIIGKKES